MLLDSTGVGRLVYGNEKLSRRRAAQICVELQAFGGLRPLMGRSRGPRFRKTDVEMAVAQMPVEAEI